jgi:hypothetical protein
MKRAIKTSITFLLLALTVLTACEKSDYIPAPPSAPEVPGKPSGNNGQPATDSTVLRLKMAIKIGDVLYDSIPFTASITSFNGSTQVAQQNYTLNAGTNTVTLYGTSDRFQVRVSKWGITDEKTLTKLELQNAGVITLGGSKAAKRLHMEEEYIFIPADGSYRAQGKTLYKYDGAGRLTRAIYYQKYPQQADLKLTLVDKFVYEPSGRLDRIDRFDANRDTTVVPASFTAFNYDGQGRVAQIYNNQTTETAASVSYGLENGFATINLSYYFGNNATMNYTMKFQGGNKVSDAARTSAGHGEGGTYTYDHNINPYVHMSWPDLYLSHESRNNVVSQQKSYGGAYPSGDPYNFEYQYDAEGYPTTKTTTYKSVLTGLDVYTTRTVYTY